VHLPQHTRGFALREKAIRFGLSGKNCSVHPRGGIGVSHWLALD
jgi:hypothetical protein